MLGQATIVVFMSGREAVTYAMPEIPSPELNSDQMLNKHSGNSEASATPASQTLKLGTASGSQTFNTSVHSAPPEVLQPNSHIHALEV